MQGYDDQGRWSDKRAAAAYKTVCAAQAILRDRRNGEKRKVNAKAKAKPTPTRKSKQLVKMAKEDLDAIKEDDDFESDEKYDAAIKEAKAVLSAHRNALREHLRTPQPMPTRAPAPMPPHNPRGEP